MRNKFTQELKQTILDAMHNANGEDLFGFGRDTACNTPRDWRWRAHFPRLDVWPDRPRRRGHPAPRTQWKTALRKGRSFPHGAGELVKPTLKGSLRPSRRFAKDASRRLEDHDAARERRMGIRPDLHHRYFPSLSVQPRLCLFRIYRPMLDRSVKVSSAVILEVQ